MLFVSLILVVKQNSNMFRHSFRFIQSQYPKRKITSWIPNPTDIKTSATKAIENLPTYEELNVMFDDTKMKVYDKSFENAMRFVKMGDEKAKNEGLTDVEITVSVALGPIALTIVKKIS